MLANGKLKCRDCGVGVEAAHAPGLVEKRLRIGCTLSGTWRCVAAGWWKVRKAYRSSSVTWEEFNVGGLY